MKVYCDFIQMLELDFAGQQGQSKEDFKDRLKARSKNKIKKRKEAKKRYLETIDTPFSV